MTEEKKRPKWVNPNCSTCDGTGEVTLSQALSPEVVTGVCHKCCYHQGTRIVQANAEYCSICGLKLLTFREEDTPNVS